MRYVKKHGNLYFEGSKTFKCPNCECIFTAEFDDCIIDEGYSFTYEAQIKCSCPECATYCELYLEEDANNG